MDDINAALGTELEKEYGEDKPQDLHIEYFFLILGQEILSKRERIIQKLNEIAGWTGLTLDRLTYIVGKFNLPLLSTERGREEELNLVFRIPLLKELGIFPDSQNPPAIIISRVCKYTSVVVPRIKLTTHEIESVLQNPNNQHLDYFYLTIHVTNFPAVVPNMCILSQLPGDWKSVTPEETWPLTFIGYFPKKSFESEREREWRLNVQVRLPLKQYFDEQSKKSARELKLSVLFSRACKYTNM